MEFFKNVFLSITYDYNKKGFEMNTFYKNPQVYNGENYPEFKNQYNFTVRYFSNFNKELLIRDRHGISLIMPANPDGQEEKLIIYYERKVCYSVKNNLSLLLNDFKKQYEQLNIVKKSFNLNFDINKNGDVNFILTYIITNEDLVRNNGFVYYNDLDIIVSLLPDQDTPPHPYSEEGRVSNLIIFDQFEKEHKTNNFLYTIKIVDKQFLIPDQYINISGKVFKVPICRLSDEKDGIYVGCFTNKTQPIDHTPYYGIDDGKKILNLFNSKEEAITLGNVEYLSKEKAIKIENELTEKKLELAKLKNENEELKTEYSKIEHKLHLEKEALKYKYDIKTIERKDTSDSVKFIPAIIAGVGAVFGALFAIFK